MRRHRKRRHYFFPPCLNIRALLAVAGLPPRGWKVIVIFSFSRWPLAFLRAFDPAPVSFSLNSTVPAPLTAEVTDFRSLPEAEIVPDPGTLMLSEGTRSFRDGAPKRELV